MSMDTQVTRSNSTSIFLHNIPDLSLLLAISSSLQEQKANADVLQECPRGISLFCDFYPFKKNIKIHLSYKTVL